MSQYEFDLCTANDEGPSRSRGGLVEWSRHHEEAESWRLKVYQKNREDGEGEEKFEGAEKEVEGVKREG